MASSEMQTKHGACGAGCFHEIAAMLLNQVLKVSSWLFVTCVMIIGLPSSVAAADPLVAFLAEGEFVWNASDAQRPQIDSACKCHCELEVETLEGMPDEQTTTRVEYLSYGDFVSNYSISYTLVKNCVFLADANAKSVKCLTINAANVTCVSCTPEGQFYVADFTPEGTTISAVELIAADQLVVTSPSLFLKGTSVKSMDVSPDGRHLAVCCADTSSGRRFIKSWDLATGKVQDLGPGADAKFLLSKIGIKAEDQNSWAFSNWPAFQAHSTMYTRSITISADRSMVLNHTDFNVYYHEHLNSTESGHAVWHPLRPFSSNEVITSCAFAPDGSELYCHTYSGELGGHQVMDRHKVWKFQFPVTNPDGKVVFEESFPAGAEATCPLKNYKALVIF